MVTVAGILSIGARSSINIITGGVARGLPSLSINALIKQSTGSGIRRTDLLAAIRYVKGISASADVIKYTRKGYLPDPSKIQASKGPILKDYSFTVKVEGTDQDTGDRVFSHVTVTADRNMTVAQIEEQAGLAVEKAEEDNPSHLPFDADSFTLVGARRRA